MDINGNLRSAIDLAAASRKAEHRRDVRADTVVEFQQRYGYAPDPTSRRDVGLLADLLLRHPERQALGL